MIRPTVVGDTPALLELTQETGVFRTQEIVALTDVLRDYHLKEHAHGHVAITIETESGISGFAYYAPDEITDRTWHLWWIVVRKSDHARGLGTTLLEHIEADVGRRNGRLLFIETSSLPHYERTRRFYLRHGYQQVAQLQDYYSDGDSKVIFAKRL